MNSAETTKPTRLRLSLQDAATERVPHPLRKLAERLGRSPGRKPLPDVFEQFLVDQMSRPVVTEGGRSAVLPSRTLVRRRRKNPRRADV
jgi:hypothetical protein